MLNSKVIEILKTFTNEEMKRFNEFLHSPFHNKNKKAILLFDLLSKYHPGYDNKNLTKEKIFDLIFKNSGKSYNDASVRNLFSDLMILTEKFLSHYRFEKDSFDFNERCLREFIDRKLLNVFDKKIKSTEDELIIADFEGENRFHRQYILDELKSFSHQFSDNLKLYKDKSIFNASENLSYFYLVRVFKMINFFRFQKMYNVSQEKNITELLLSGIDFDKIDKEFKNRTDKNYLIFSIYYKMYLALTSPGNDEHYFEYKKQLLKNDKLFSMLEKYGLYVCLTNACVQKIDMDKENFSKECFEVYLIMIEKNLFAAYTGYFPMSAFSAILHTGLAAGELEKTEKILNEYLSKLNPEHEADASNYFSAQLCFHKKDFNKSLEYLSKTDTEFSQFKYHIKILSLKNYFELGDFESLYYSADAFQHFLNKNKLVGENYKNEFNNFLKILDLLVKFRSLKEEKKKFTIKHLLENKSIAGRKWLIEKLDEIS